MVEDLEENNWAPHPFLAPFRPDMRLWGVLPGCPAAPNLTQALQMKGRKVLPKREGAGRPSDPKNDRL